MKSVDWVETLLQSNKDQHGEIAVLRVLRRMLPASIRRNTAYAYCALLRGLR